MQIGEIVGNIFDDDLGMITNMVESQVEVRWENGLVTWEFIETITEEKEYNV